EQIQSIGNVRFVTQPVPGQIHEQDTCFFRERRRLVAPQRCVAAPTGKENDRASARPDALVVDTEAVQLREFIDARYHDSRTPASRISINANDAPTAKWSAPTKIRHNTGLRIAHTP